MTRSKPQRANSQRSQASTTNAAGRRSAPKKLPVLKTDPQRPALSKLEKEFESCALGHRAPLTLLRDLAKKVCTYYDVPLPVIRFANEPGMIYGWTDSPFDDEDRTYIYLNDGGPKGASGQNGLTLVHELAHHIVDRRFEDHESHGPEFCGVYMHLLNKYRFIPEDCFRLIARRWGLRIAREYLPGAIV